MGKSFLKSDVGQAKNDNESDQSSATRWSERDVSSGLNQLGRVGQFLEPEVFAVRRSNTPLRGLGDSSGRSGARCTEGVL